MLRCVPPVSYLFPLLTLVAACAVPGRSPREQAAAAQAEAAARARAAAEEARWNTPPDPPPPPVSIAVQPLAANLADGDAKERGRREFEQWFVATRLADHLREQSWVSAAYCTTRGTPAVDILVSGSILRSTAGQMLLVLDLTLPDGTALGQLRRGYAFHDSSADGDGLGEFCVQLANGIGRCLAERLTPGLDATVVRPRVAAYAGQAVTAVPEDARLLVERFAAVERAQLLAPMTQLCTAAAAEAAPAYGQWRARMMDLQSRIEERQREQRAAERRAERAKDRAAMMGAIQALGASLSARAGAPPDFSFVNTLQQGESEASLHREEAEAHAQAARELERCSTAFSQRFGQDSGRTSFAVEGRVFETSGRLADQLDQLRQVARTRLQEYLGGGQ